jgi:putative redox protein
MKAAGGRNYLLGCLLIADQKRLLCAAPNAERTAYKLNKITKEFSPWQTYHWCEAIPRCQFQERDTMALKDIIVATQTDLRANPDHAIATFSADSRQVEGLRSETKIRQFSVTVDEPPSLGGTDTGPNPVELVLAALATCQEITYRAYATALGIPLESVSVKLEGLLDLRGFFAVKDDVRASFNEVRGVVNLKSSASPADLAKLKEVVDAHCPVLDILRAPVPVDLRLETERAVQAA